MSNTQKELTKPLPAESFHSPEAETSTIDKSQSLLNTFREMVCELVKYRELLLQLTLRDIRIRYKQAVMGIGWALLMPMLIVGAGFLIKYVMAQMSSTELSTASLAGVAVKAVPWAFFVGSVGFATISLTSNIILVTKVYFPREIFPLSAVLAQVFDSAIGSAVLAVLLSVFLRVGFSLQLLWVPLILAFLFLFTIGAALFLSCANVFFRDVKYLVQVLLTFGIFFTPVFYEPTDLGPTGSSLMMLNPLTPLLEGIRLAVIEHHNLLYPFVVTSQAGMQILAWHPGYLLYAVGWAVMTSLAAWLIFHKLQFVYPEYI